MRRQSGQQWEDEYDNDNTTIDDNDTTTSNHYWSTGTTHNDYDSNETDTAASGGHEACHR